MSKVNHLRLTRFRAGLTLSALAEKAGVTRAVITALEEGQRPRAPQAAALATALGVDVAELWPDEFTQDAAA